MELPAYRAYRQTFGEAARNKDIVKEAMSREEFVGTLRRGAKNGAMREY